LKISCQKNVDSKENPYSVARNVEQKFNKNSTNNSEFFFQTVAKILSVELGYDPT
jgi:hypothetical protein